MDMSILKEITTGDNEKGSSKKVVVFICLILITIITLVNLFTEFKGDQHIFDMIVYLIIAAAGLSVADRRINNPSPDISQPDQQTTVTNITKTVTTPPPMQAPVIEVKPPENISITEVKPDDKQQD